ncbi:MAG TPA: hypothetical protein VIE65_13870 [Methylobacter sp.]|jgi:hypothetical protein
MSTKSPAISQVAANKLREKALGLVVQDTKCQLEIAETLYELYYGTVEVGGGELALYKFFGYPSWFAYVEEEVGMHITTSHIYRNVHDIFMIRLKGKWDIDLMPSWTKMKALARLSFELDAKNVNSWLKKAKRMPACALEEEIDEALYGRQKKGAHRHFLAMLTDRQLTSANAVIELGRQEFEKESLEMRGERILEQWSAAVMQKNGREKLRVVPDGKSRKFA